MGLAGNVVRILVTSALLAAWTVFIQPFFLTFLWSGKPFGYLETFIAYALLMFLAQIASYVLIKSLGGGEND